jgi:hypothetical protein
LVDRGVIFRDGALKQAAAGSGSSIY